jgi:hypothetical protein
MVHLKACVRTVPCSEIALVIGASLQRATRTSRSPSYHRAEIDAFREDLAAMWLRSDNRIIE